MAKLITLPFLRSVMWMSACCLVFLGAWYDTCQAHLYSEALNSWILQTLYVPATIELTHNMQLFYRESLEAVASLGSEIIFFLALSVIFTHLLLRGEFKTLLQCLLVVVLVLLLTWIGKQLIISPRPLLPLRLDSFPSGHVVRAGLWCGVIVFLARAQVLHLSGYWLSVWGVIPLLVAYSRVSLGMHWLSDVLASLMLVLVGFSLIYLSGGVFGRIGQKFDKHG